jgi:hypothetical protein
MNFDGENFKNEFNEAFAANNLNTENITARQL